MEHFFHTSYRIWYHRQVGILHSVLGTERVVSKSIPINASSLAVLPLTESFALGISPVPGSIICLLTPRSSVRKVLDSMIEERRKEKVEGDLEKVNYLTPPLFNCSNSARRTSSLLPSLHFRTSLSLSPQHEITASHS